MTPDALDVLKDISPEELEQPLPEPSWKKPVLIGIGVFLTVLILSLTFSDQLTIVIGSERVKGSTLVFPNVTVVFEGNVLSVLQQEYVANEHREIKACLFGEIQESLYIIRTIEFPEVVDASVAHVRAQPCPIDAMIDLHSHPIRRCVASTHDVELYERLRESNPEMRMMVMCGRSRFSLI